MRFVLKRLALFVVALFGLSVVVFAALRILPGPRSAVALTREGKILLIVVDGRRKGKAEGINIPELAHMIRILGGEDALNLDGGGSSTLWSGALPDKGIANTPSGSAERKVANSLCVYE